MHMELQNNACSSCPANVRNSSDLPILSVGADSSTDTDRQQQLPADKQHSLVRPVGSMQDRRGPASAVHLHPQLPNVFASASMMPGGALVFSNGDAAMAARSASTGRNSNMYHNTPAYGSTALYDPDLENLGAGNGTVCDSIALSFDLTPTLSGPVTFRCAEQTRCVRHAVC